MSPGFQTNPLERERPERNADNAVRDAGGKICDPGRQLSASPTAPHLAPTELLAMSPRDSGTILSSRTAPLG